MSENHKDGDKFHLVGLDTDVDNALQFTIKKYAAARKVEEDKDEHEFVYTPTDTIYVISTLGTYDKKKGYVPAYDTLKVVSYSFVNQWNEPLKYGKIDNISNNAYYSDVYYDKTKDEGKVGKEELVKLANASLATAHKYAQKFAIRVDNGKYNLRPVSFSRTAQYETKLASGWEAGMYQIFNNNADLVKMYAGDATGSNINTKVKK